MIKHQGGCHCGAVKFNVMAPSQLKITDCNCSICEKTGFLHLIVPADRFEIVSGNENLTTYSFNTKTAKHFFCKTCGIKSFYVPRSHPDGYSVNARCLEPETIESMQIEKANGKEWEKTFSKGRGDFS